MTLAGAMFHVAMTPNETLSVQLERLRALYTLLAFAPDAQCQDELIERTRVAIADVRKTRAALAAMSQVRATTSQACLTD